MSKQVLKLIADAMKSLGIAYGFEEYSGNPVVYPYFVGEYAEPEPTTEDGLQETTFLINGFNRGSWLALENDKEKIAKYFDRVSGKTAIVDDGSAVAVFYAGSIPVSTGDAELKRIEITLHIKEWMVL